jgi:hypothetical protein
VIIRRWSAAREAGRGGEIRDAGPRGSRAEHVRTEGIEARLDLNVDVAVERSPPDVRRELECDQALLPACRSRVAANRRHRRRIVETLVRTVGIDDRDARAGGSR